MTTETKAPAGQQQARHRRTLIGLVTAAKMQKTITVEVTRSVRHPIYGKYIHLKQKYKVHDEKGQYKVGDYVEIREHRPLSRDKRWAAVKLIDRREQG